MAFGKVATHLQEGLISRHKHFCWIFSTKMTSFLSVSTTGMIPGTGIESLKWEIAPPSVTVNRLMTANYIMRYDCLPKQRTAFVQNTLTILRFCMTQYNCFSSWYVDSFVSNRPLHSVVGGEMSFAFLSNLFAEYPSSTDTDWASVIWLTAGLQPWLHQL